MQRQPRRTFVPFRTPVRGHAFAARPPQGPTAGPGLPVELRREPDNPRDPWAVAVWSAASAGTPWRLGYLERAVAARLGPRLDRGEITVEGALVDWWEAPDGGWRRPVVALAPSATAAAADGTPVRTERRAHAGHGGAGVTPRLWGQPPRSRRRVLDRGTPPGP